MKQDSPPQISILIPVLNEAELIGDLLTGLRQKYSQENIAEIVVIDGGSSDATIQIATNHNIKILHSKKGRATQMNVGAKYAQGELLYFLHADTSPPQNFDQYILDAHRNGFEAGCFRMRFDSNNPMLRFFGWLTRINHTLCRGGDQSLFITKEQFKKNGGFNEAYLIYEDSEFIHRLYQNLRFRILPYHVITSARKYREKGWLKVQYHFAVIHLKNYFGAGPKELFEYYRKKILA